MGKEINELTAIPAAVVETDILELEDDPGGSPASVKCTVAELRQHLDNEKTVFGTGDDSSIYFDATNLLIDPEVNGVIVSNTLNIYGGTGNVLIHDTSNAKNTQGLTINQLAADDEALSLKSSDVAAGTIWGETDTFASLKKASATAGGLFIRSKTDVNGGGATPALILEAHADDSFTNATKTTSAAGLIELRASQHNSAGTAADVVADGNILAVQARISGSLITRWLLDEDGDTYQAGNLNPFDDNTDNIGNSSARWAALSLGGYVEVGTNPATAGRYRIDNNQAFYSRNAANSANIWVIGVDSGDNVQIANGGEDTKIGGSLIIDNVVNLKAATSLTIATGAVAITTSYHTIVVEGGAGAGSDDLSTATGGAEGDLLILKTTTSGASDTVTVKNGTGSDTFILASGADFAMDHIDDRIEFIHNGTEWVERSRSNNS